MDERWANKLDHLEKLKNSFLPSERTILLNERLYEMKDFIKRSFS